MAPATDSKSYLTRTPHLKLSKPSSVRKDRYDDASVLSGHQTLVVPDRAHVAEGWATQNEEAWATKGDKNDFT
jgi:hypothetical protein